MVYTAVAQSPLGPLTLTADDKALLNLQFGNFPGGEGSALLTEALRQLDGYFAGALTAFDLPLAPRGTPFQRAVWDALRRIAYGETVTYKQLASLCGSPRAFRAVGQANRRNPLPILIPCHRVVASNGGIGGYLGVWGDAQGPKSWLLAHERLKNDKIIDKINC